MNILPNRPLTMEETRMILGGICRNSVYKLERLGFLKRVDFGGLDVLRYDWNSVMECSTRLASRSRRKRR